MSSDAPEFLLAFESLTDLNAVKRAFRGLYLPLRQLPAYLAKTGCGHALNVTREQLSDVEQTASRLCVGYRLFTLQPAPDAARYHLEREESFP